MTEFPKAAEVKMPAVPRPRLLLVPEHFRSVEEVLECAGKMDLPNVLVLSELDYGRIVFLDSGLNFAQTNWLLDRMKTLLLAPSGFEKTK